MGDQSRNKIRLLLSNKNRKDNADESKEKSPTNCSEKNELELPSD